MNNKEGVIKFKYELKKKPLSANLEIGKLVKHRNKLFNYGLIGSDKNGTGYGNISVRYKSSEKFIISASDTGRIKLARKYHFSFVNSVDVKKNFVWCTGMKAASSETMTHFIIYNLSSGIKCVIHVHNQKLWKRLLNKAPTTSKRISYGTPEMAYDIKRLLSKPGLKEKKILVMAGHKGGLVVFGKSIEEAYNVIADYFNS